MRRFIYNRDGFLTILGLLVAVLIVCFLYYIFLTRPAQQVDEPTQNMISQSGIDNSSYQSTLNSTLRQIKNMEQNQLRGGQDVNLILDEVDRNK